MRVRLALLTFMLLCGAGAVLHRAWRLQIVQGDELRAMAEEQYLRNIRLAPKRGTIFDRNGAELAVSVDVESLWANPRAVQEAGAVDRVSAALAPIVGIDANEVRALVSQPRRFRWIRRRLTPTQAAAVRALRLPGIGLDTESRRYYPNRELAAHVLGFANVDGVGVEGIERALEDDLRGSRVSVNAIQDASRRVVFSDGMLDDAATAGHDVQLTIDRAIQHVAEREIAMAVRNFEALAGTVVVIAPSTGDILAMASVPTFNPNEPGIADVGSRRNRAITDRFEPGSTLKVFTVAGALARGAVAPDQPIYCERGAMQVDEYVIHDSHVHEWLTPAQILQRSSNIGSSKIGNALGRRNLYRALRAFGFGERTNVPMTGEVAGSLRHYRRWYAMDAATIPFGQGMSVTALQLAMATAAVANGGRLMVPRLVRRVVSTRGETVRDVRPEVRRRVVPENVARLVSDMMTAVTGPNGTGIEAAIDGYLVAGKTGTAQKADDVAGGYDDTRWTSSFVGFVPADRPRLAIVVIVDEPALARAGGSVAAPVFRRVAEAALRHLGVPADGGGGAIAEQMRQQQEAADGGVAGTASDAGVAGSRSGELVLRPRGDREAETALQRDSDELDDEPEGDAPDEPHLANVEPPTPVREPAEGEVRVPDLMGTSIRAALRRIRESELEAEVIGSGVVTAVTPPAGSIVPQHTRLRVRLAPPREDEEAPPSPAPSSEAPPTLPSAPGTSVAQRDDSQRRARR
ncbi:MAG: PASTA domain-containing protein [Deltaproteobacteria bacterium]|nr:PASTA domain-containing protein [Deltaproteobacteria bacterium]